MNTISSRYQVIHPIHGLIGTFDKKKDAFKMAAYKSMKENDSYEVFDLMAKKNMTEKWIFHSDGQYKEIIRK